MFLDHSCLVKKGHCVLWQIPVDCEAEAAPDEAGVVVETSFVPVFTQLFSSSPSGQSKENVSFFKIMTTLRLSLSYPDLRHKPRHC